MKKKYFGTDGIRGEFNKFPIIPSFFYKLAVALSNSKKKVKKVLIGKDTRESCKFIEQSLLNGFNFAEISSQFIGIVSTPVLSFYTKLMNYDYGIMISASHNPYTDNGIKIFKNNGEKLNDKEELRIETLINRVSDNNKIIKEKIYYKKLDLEEYKNSILKKFPKGEKKIKILLDCANGSVSKLAPIFFKEVGAEVIKYSYKPNGKNINKNCGAMFPNRLAELTKKHNADIGLSFDGDADRVIISDERGEILDGSIILAAILKFQKFGSPKKIKSIVSTYMSNLSFREFLKKSKIKLYLTNVGDRYVIEEMKKKKSILGGEPSGHIIFSENGYCGDGILTSMHIINIISSRKIKLSYLRNNLFKNCYQKLVNLKLKNEPEKIIMQKEFNETLNFVNKNYKEIDYLIRKSGTENLLRIMVQSKNKNHLEKVLKLVISLIKKLDD